MSLLNDTVPHRVNEVENSIKFKVCFSEGCFPWSPVVSFQIPLSNPLVVPTEAWTQDQLMQFQLRNKEGPAFHTQDKEPKTPCSLNQLSEHMQPVFSMSAVNLLRSRGWILSHSDIVFFYSEHGTYVTYMFAQCTHSIFPHEESQVSLPFSSTCM